MNDLMTTEDRLEWLQETYRELMESNPHREVDLMQQLFKELSTVPDAVPIISYLQNNPEQVESDTEAFRFVFDATSHQMLQKVFPEIWALPSFRDIFHPGIYWFTRVSRYIGLKDFDRAWDELIKATRGIREEGSVYWRGYGWAWGEDLSALTKIFYDAMVGEGVVFSDDWRRLWNSGIKTGTIVCSVNSQMLARPEYKLAYFMKVQKDSKLSHRTTYTFETERELGWSLQITEDGILALTLGHYFRQKKNERVRIKRNKTVSKK